MAKKASTALLGNKHDFLRRLYESDKYKQTMSRARTDGERKAIAGLVTEFVGGFAEILAPIIDRAQHDSVFAGQLGRAVVERQGVVTGGQPASSGSAIG